MTPWGDGVLIGTRCAAHERLRVLFKHCLTACFLPRYPYVRTRTVDVSSLSRTLFDAAPICCDVMIIVQFPADSELEILSEWARHHHLSIVHVPSSIPLIAHILAYLFRVLVPLHMVMCGLDFRVPHALHVSTITDDVYEPRRRLFVCHTPVAVGDAPQFAISISTTSC